jgi:hypothetical protein
MRTYDDRPIKMGFWKIALPRSALPLKADKLNVGIDVCYVPLTDIAEQEPGAARRT